MQLVRQPLFRAVLHTVQVSVHDCPRSLQPLIVQLLRREEICRRILTQGSLQIRVIDVLIPLQPLQTRFGKTLLGLLEIPRVRTDIQARRARIAASTRIPGTNSHRARCHSGPCVGRINPCPTISANNFLVGGDGSRLGATLLPRAPETAERGHKELEFDGQYSGDT